GSAHNFTVTAKDSNDNTAPSYGGTVHFTSSDGQAVLPANYTLVRAAGRRVATLKTGGSQSITATDTATASITGTQGSITVNAGGATTLGVAGYPSPTTAGAAQNFTVTAKDTGGNAATGYLGTVHFTSSDGAAVLPANYTFVAADNGAHTFSATLKTAGTATSIATNNTTTATTTANESYTTETP